MCGLNHVEAHFQVQCEIYVLQPGVERGHGCEEVSGLGSHKFRKKTLGGFSLLGFPLPFPYPPSFPLCFGFKPKFA